MGAVLQVLVGGVGVHRGHEAALDAEASLKTFARGARQFVVQDAFEMMWCVSGL